MQADGGSSRRITIRQVAEDAGVSVSAVSKVLRDAYGVSDALRARVEASIELLQYRPLASARGMRGKTYTLGLVLPDIRNPFFADILNGVGIALVGTQYQTVVGIIESTTSEDAAIESLIDRQVDGMVLVAPLHEHRDMDRLAARVPVVAIGYHAASSSAFDTVNNDDQAGAREAIRHLLSNGFRDIAMLSLDARRSTIIAQRELGYRMEMLDAGAGERIKVVRASSAYAELGMAAERLLRDLTPPAAVFCWSDLAAFKLLSVAHDLGLVVPTDVGIVGYDNTVICGLAQNSLTSIDQSGSMLGAHAVRLLLERIGGRGDAEHVVVQPVLMARKSTSRVEMTPLQS